MSEGYVHGYHPRENERLHDQAGALVELLHSDTAYPAGSSVLEAGCGVGAQTLTLARRSPGARFLSIDISAESVAEARSRVGEAGLANVELRQADIFALPFDTGSFDHSILCWSERGSMPSVSLPGWYTWTRAAPSSSTASRARPSRRWWRASATPRSRLD